MRKSKAITGVLLSAAVAMVMAGCGSSNSSSSSNSGGNAAPAASNNNASSSGSSDKGGTIKIGSIGALSGNLASLGTWDSQGLEMVVEEVNAKGGIHGKKLEIEQLDDQGNPTVAVNEANKLVNDKVVAAMATPESTTALATLNIFNSAKIPQMSAGSSAELSKKGSKYFFRDTASSDVFGKTLASYIAEKMPGKKVAVISNSGAFGKSEHDAFVASLKSHNINPVADQVITPEAKDFSAQLTNIKAANPDVLYIGTEEIQMGLIVKQARALGIKAQVMAGAGMGTQVYINTAGKDVANGSIFTTTYVSNDATAETKAWAAAYQKKYGQVADSHVAKAYDGAKMIVAAMEKAYPNIDGEHIGAALHGMDYHGLTGDFKFDDKGEGLSLTQMGTIKNGVPVPLN